MTRADRTDEALRTSRHRLDVVAVDGFCRDADGCRPRWIPGPPVRAPVLVVDDQRLSSHTNSTGRSYTHAQLSASRNGPLLTAPSPKKHATTFGLPCSLRA